MLESPFAVAAAELEHEPVSPELVLVDPDLARRARRALIVHPQPPSPSAPSSAPPQRRLLVVATALILGCGATTIWLLGGEPAPTPPAPQARSPAPLEEPLRFTWAPVLDAHSYRLDLYRGTTRIYSAVTTLPERTVPAPLEARRPHLPPHARHVSMGRDPSAGSVAALPRRQADRRRDLHRLSRVHPRSHSTPDTVANAQPRFLTLRSRSSRAPPSRGL